jgi:AcrR family transcriptional regulator
MIAYYFGNKAGLIATMLDAIVYDECMAIAERIRDADEGERLHVLTVSLRDVTATSEGFHGFFDLLPHALRDDVLRRRLVELYEWYITFELRWLGLETVDGRSVTPAVRGLAQLIAAVIDGVGIQARIDPRAFDPARTFEALDVLLSGRLAALADQS